MSGGRPARAAVTLALLIGHPKSEIEVGAERLTLRRPLTGRPQRTRVIRIPDVLWLSAAELEALADRPIDAASGLGAVLATLLDQILESFDAARADEWADEWAGEWADEWADEWDPLAPILRDLLSAAAADCVAEHPHRWTPRRRLVIESLQTINAELDDPRLTGAAVAARHGVSVRTLQLAYRDSDLSVAETIRALRLERARRDLTVDRAAADDRRALAERRVGARPRSGAPRGG